MRLFFYLFFLFPTWATAQVAPALPHAPALTKDEPWRLSYDIKQFGIAVGGLHVTLKLIDAQPAQLRTEIRDWSLDVPGLISGESHGYGLAEILPGGLSSLSVFSVFSGEGGSGFGGVRRDGVLQFHERPDPRTSYSAQSAALLAQALDSYSLLGHILTQTPVGQCPPTRAFAYPHYLAELVVSGSGQECSLILRSVEVIGGGTYDDVVFDVTMGEVEGAWIPVRGLMRVNGLVSSVSLRQARAQ